MKIVVDGGNGIEHTQEVNTIRFTGGPIGVGLYSDKGRIGWFSHESGRWHLDFMGTSVREFKVVD